MTAIHDIAFPQVAGRHSVESGLLGKLRSGSEWIDELSLVAVLDERPVGHVVCTRGRLTVSGPADAHPDLPGISALGLGPIGVLPDHQGHGVGSALMHAILGAAEALDETVVCLLGEPRFYSRFGFRPAAELGIASPDDSWGTYFQARVLSSEWRPPAGLTFHYAAAFDGL